jgi:uncharacterized membrane protein
MAMPAEQPEDDPDYAVTGPPRVWSRGSTEFERVVFLSDAVIAIALTILVLDLEVPTVDASDLPQALREEWGSFFAFGLTFAIIAVSWMGHHRFVSALVRMDIRLVQWNFLYLAAICLMPFGSSLISEHADDSSLAVAIYLGLIATLFLIDVLGDVIAVRHHLLGTPGFPPWIRYEVIDSLVRIAVFVVGIAIAYVASVPSAGMLWLFALFPAGMLTSRLDPSRRLDRSPQPGR